jgi:hypothetical protein
VLHVLVSWCLLYVLGMSICAFSRRFGYHVAIDASASNDGSNIDESGGSIAPVKMLLSDPKFTITAQCNGIARDTRHRRHRNQRGEDAVRCARRD